MSVRLSEHERPTDGVSGDDSGVEGNSRLTSATGILLLAMLAVEGYTVLDVRGLITLHIFLGVLLVGPVLLKVAATLYRFARYYSGDARYVRKGPPHIVLRVLGPLVVISSLAVLGTGLGLLAVDRGDSLLLTAHKASFVIWFGVMTLHVLGHLREAVLLSWRDLRESSSHRRMRLALITLAIVAGVGAAAAVTPTATSWTHRGREIGHHHHR